MSEGQALTNFSPSPVSSEPDPILQDLAGQLLPSSRRMYRHDAQAFAAWMLAQGLTPQSLEKSHVVAYRAYLQDHYAKATARRMLSVARQLLAEQVERKQIASNPASGVRGFKGEDETPHVALKEDQAQALLDAIDITTLSGLRDYVLILFLLRTGIRRSEAAALTWADLKMREGHHVAFIEHGKGDKRRVVKVPVEVFRELEGYREALRQYHQQRATYQLEELADEQSTLDKDTYQAQWQAIIDQHTMSADDALFVRIRRGEHATLAGISDRSIATIVEYYAEKAGIEDLSPHGLRASFITLTLEAGASLHQVQYAAGHSDPRTTERYQKRKLNLDNNAVDR